MNFARILFLAALALATPAGAQSISGGPPPGTTPLGQSRIPFCLVSSGTMGNNGALSGIVAVGQAYPAAYVYMPAGAIAAGSAAGYFYAVFSSTTAATLYNNLYTSGTPVVPASPTAFATTGPGAYTQTIGNYFAAYQLPIPAGSIGINGALRATGGIVGSTDAGGKLVQWTLGTTPNTNVLGFTSGTTTIGLGFIGGFVNRNGVTNSQMTFGTAGFNVNGNNAGPYYTAVDMTAPQVWTTHLRIAAVTSSFCLEAETVEIIPGVP